MNDINNSMINSECVLKSREEFDEQFKEITSREQLYSIALFDILGFSNLVENHGNKVILNLYNKLVDIINKQKSGFNGSQSFASVVAPVPISNDWKSGQYIAGASGCINVCHFSDTFLIYVNYNFRKKGEWLATGKTEPYPLLLLDPDTPNYPIFYERHHIFLSFLQTCMEFFCQAIVAGIPLRGCVSTGLAIMNPDKSIYLGNPLVEAARGETAQNALGVAFGKSFINLHPVYNDYFIPYLKNFKEEKLTYLSPMMLNWPHYWRTTPDYKEYDFFDCIKKMNIESKFTKYYDAAVEFFEFSAKHENWPYMIDRDEIKDINDYYERIKKWLCSVASC